MKQLGSHTPILPAMSKGESCYVAPRRVKATYRKRVEESVVGSPMLAALPAVRAPSEWTRLLLHRPSLPKGARLASREARPFIAADLVQSSFLPHGQTLKLACQIDRLIRRGYQRTSPMDRGFNRDMFERLNGFRTRSTAPQSPGALGGFLVGEPGLGKSRSVRQILQTYPAVIEHEMPSDFGGTFRQVTHLTVLVPPDASVRGLCVRFVEALDDTLGTDYAARERIYKRSAGYLEHIMAELALQHALGILVVDDFHHLSNRASGGRAALKDTLAQVTDWLGIPILLVGIPRAEDIIRSERYLEKRFGSDGLSWIPLGVTSPDEKDKDAVREEWHGYLESLLCYQTTQHPLPLTDAFADRWHKCSGGIPHKVNEDFLRSVRNGILLGTERLGSPLDVDQGAAGS